MEQQLLLQEMCDFKGAHVRNQYMTMNLTALPRGGLLPGTTRGICSFGPGRKTSLSTKPRCRTPSPTGSSSGTLTARWARDSIEVWLAGSYTESASGAHNARAHRGHYTAAPRAALLI